MKVFNVLPNCLCSHRPLFSLERKGPKGFRPRPPVRLELEDLEGRILLSTSPVGQPSVSTPLVAVMDRVDQMIVVVQNEANSLVRTITQEIVQELAYLELQLDHIFGIDTASQNTALNSSMQPVGNGSGNIVTMASNASNQGANIGTLQAGNGSGSSNATIKPQVAPDGPDAGGVSGFLWDPTVKTNGEFLASTAVNWDYNMKSQVNALNPKRPGDTTDSVTFDPKLTDPTVTPGLHGNGDAPIIWDYGPKIPLMNVGGMSAYTTMQTINSGITVELTGSDGTSLNMVQPTSTLNLLFLAASSKFQIDSNATITNLDILGGEGLFEINGGITTLAQSSSYEYDIEAPLDVAQGATLDDQSYAALNFQSQNVTLSIEGTMLTFYGTGNGTTLMTTANNNNGDFINVNSGSLEYYGKGGVTDKFMVPVFVQNGGEFVLTSSSSQPAGGKLSVENGTNTTFPNGKAVSVDTTGVFSSVQLSQGFTLETDDGYYQDSGFLETTDNTQCTIALGSDPGVACVIDGGTLLIDSQKNSYGRLNVIGGMNLNGELNVSIQGYDPKSGLSQCDVLYVAGEIIVSNTTSTLFVNNYGAQQGDSWVIITSPNNIAGNFSSKPTFSPPASFTFGIDPKNLGNYKISL